VTKEALIRSKNLLQTVWVNAKTLSVHSDVFPRNSADDSYDEPTTYFLISGKNLWFLT
jgi:hypothetical protein